jgi:anthranilate 1,2-dioxygenase small subunit
MRGNPAYAANELPFELRWRVADLNERYVRCLDDNEFDAWPGFFTEDGIYRIVPRENLDAGLPGSILFFDSNAMRRDRMLCVREVNIYRIHVARHYLGGVVIARQGEDAFAMRANFLVVHSDNEGRSSLYASGEYRDTVILRGDSLLFREKTVILDTFTIPGQLAEPL